MAKLDAFVNKLFAEQGEALVFETGANVILDAGDRLVPIMKVALTDGQITGTLLEVAPALYRGKPLPNEPISYLYEHPKGAVEILLERTRTGVRGTVIPLARPAAKRSSSPRGIAPSIDLAAEAAPAADAAAPDPGTIDLGAGPTIDLATEAAPAADAAAPDPGTIDLGAGPTIDLATEAAPAADAAAPDPGTIDLGAGPTIDLATEAAPAADAAAPDPGTINPGDPAPLESAPADESAPSLDLWGAGGAAAAPSMDLSAAAGAGAAPSMDLSAAAGAGAAPSMDLSAAAGAGAAPSMDLSAAAGAGAAPSIDLSGVDATPGEFAAPIELPGQKPVRAAAPAGAPGEARAVMDGLLSMLATQRGSDLFLASGSVVTLRVDGGLQPRPEHGVLAESRVRELVWSIAPEENRAEYESRNDTCFVHEGAGARFRVTVFAGARGMAAAIRRVSALIPAEQIGLPKPLLDACAAPKGVVLVAGPSGSGTSTTLAALIDFVNRVRVEQVVTIEDPVEQLHVDKKCVVVQRGLGAHTTSFGEAFRSALRSGAGVLSLGEAGDEETAGAVLEAAESGRMVFALVRAPTARGAVERFLGTFAPERQAWARSVLAGALKGVVAQALCRKTGGGWVAALEVLLGTPAVAGAIREGKTADLPAAIQAGKGGGMCLLNGSLADLVRKKLVDPKEAYARSQAPGELKAMLGPA
jgi:twitching motility protein PilT